MKFIFAFIFLNLFCVFSVSAQNDSKIDLSFLDSIKIPAVEIEREKEEEEIIFSFDAFTDPVFEGGMSNFYKIVNKNLRSVDDKIGRIFIQFLIDTTGKMSEFRIPKGLSAKSDAEVLRLMKWINEKYSWKPSKDTRTQKKIKSRIAIPIVFGEENILVYDADGKEIKEIINQDKIYMCVENPPVFEGGMDNFYKIIQKNLELAEKPKEIGSIVLIEFVIDTTGKMTDFKILKSSFSEKNNEGFLQLLDSINSTYTWKPAMHKGKKVFYRMSLPIRICLLD